MASITSPEQGAQQECSSSLSAPSGRVSWGRIKGVVLIVSTLCEWNLLNCSPVIEESERSGQTPANVNIHVSFLWLRSRHLIFPWSCDDSQQSCIDRRNKFDIIYFCGESSLTRGRFGLLLSAGIHAFLLTWGESLGCTRHHDSFFNFLSHWKGTECTSLIPLFLRFFCWQVVVPIWFSAHLKNLNTRLCQR